MTCAIVISELSLSDLTIAFSLLLIVAKVSVVVQKVVSILHKPFHIEILKLILFWVVTHHCTKLMWKLFVKHHLTYKCLNNFFVIGKVCKVVVSMYIYVENDGNVNANYLRLKSYNRKYVAVFVFVTIIFFPC